MAYILNIETTTKACSVVLSSAYNILAKKESQSTYTHSENITLFVAEVLEIAGISLEMLSAICISKGPGSYMGLRIGVSTAKGFCYALNKPLIAVDTLQAMARKASLIIKDETALYCPMLDARRMEVYCSLFTSNFSCIKPTHAKIIDDTSFEEELKGKRIYFFGDGASKCKDILSNNANAFIYESYEMSADALIAFAYEKYLKNEFEDTAYFEPFYLKDFIPGISKVKGLDLPDQKFGI